MERAPLQTLRERAPSRKRASFLFGAAENYDKGGGTPSCISWRVLLESVRSEKIRQLTKYYPCDV